MSRYAESVAPGVPIAGDSFLRPRGSILRRDVRHRCQWSVAGSVTVTPADLLAFEAANPVHTPSKEERIRRELGITPTRYVVLLHRAASSAESIAAHPLVARRVRDRVAARAAARIRRTAA
ncbi:DUF3263 domain-containing protein [Microbacterium sp. NPDC087592]|uniref:DUF3263 domain-containing protein n=1 Tax=Microbacterium sp. NPDC087592 TaxID=3364193 RepID=UPI0037F1F29D